LTAIGTAISTILSFLRKRCKGRRCWPPGFASSRLPRHSSHQLTIWRYQDHLRGSINLHHRHPSHSTCCSSAVPAVIELLSHVPCPHALIAMFLPCIQSLSQCNICVKSLSLGGPSSFLLGGYFLAPFARQPARLATLETSMFTLALTSRECSWQRNEDLAIFLLLLLLPMLTSCSSSRAATRASNRPSILNAQETRVPGPSAQTF
jgi:hypothetical protein